MTPRDDGTERGAKERVVAPRPQAEVDHELEFHLEQRVREYEARGMSPDEARRTALARFGDVTSVRSECTSMLEAERRAERRRDWLDDLRQDVGFALRSALRSPLFSLLAIATLALGIGANAAVFGVLKSVLLDGLPYQEPEKLVRVYGRLIDGSLDKLPVTAGTVLDLRERQRSFTRLAAFEGQARDAIYVGQGEPQVVKSEFVEPALFSVLGARAASGRLLSDDDAVSDTATTVVLSHAAWQRLFAGDPGVVSRQLRINGISRTVVGVLPRDFVGPVSGVDVFMPINLALYARDAMQARRQHWLGIVGRLAPGTTLDGARRELTALFDGVRKAYPQYSATSELQFVSVPDDMVGNTRSPLLILMASAALVLVITCANLTGALLSRTVTRRKEFAVRVAIGAGRGRLVRQLLTESAVLSLVGGGLGLFLAWLGLRALRGLALPALPAYADLSLDPGAVVVTSSVALLTGLAVGLIPALAAGRGNQEGALREEGRSASEGSRTRTLRGLLVAGQIALCFSLLSGAGLLARSLWEMTRLPLGFDPEGVLSVAVQLPRAGYEHGVARVRFIEQFEEKLRAIPGVTSVASAAEPPTQTSNRNGFTPEGKHEAGGAPPLALYSTVSDDYFRTLAIPLREGRTFDATDRLDAPLTIIVSQELARRFWPQGGAVGSRVLMSPEPDAPRATIVGVVGDVRNNPSQRDAEPVMYMSNRQAPWNGPVFLLRTKGDPLALLPQARRVLAEIDPALPLHQAWALPELLSSELAGRRLPVVLMTAFGALALLLASVGVYAMFASMAAAREREFGVRMALGASRGAIARLVLRQGGVWMLAGVAAGGVGVVAVTGLLRGALEQGSVSRFDPLALGASLAALLVCATAALLIPVRRATKADPVATMR